MPHALQMDCPVGLHIGVPAAAGEGCGADAAWCAPTARRRQTAAERQAGVAPHAARAAGQARQAHVMIQEVT